MGIPCGSTKHRGFASRGFERFFHILRALSLLFRLSHGSVDDRLGSFSTVGSFVLHRTSEDLASRDRHDTAVAAVRKKNSTDEDRTMRVDPGIPPVAANRTAHQAVEMATQFHVSLRLDFPHESDHHVQRGLRLPTAFHFHERRIASSMVDCR